MKIVNKSNLIPFGNLSCGEVFRDSNTHICMKCEYANMLSTNTVYLEDGSLTYFDDDILVERVDCELVLLK